MHKLKHLLAGILFVLVILGTIGIALYTQSKSRFTEQAIEPHTSSDGNYVLSQDDFLFYQSFWSSLVDISEAEFTSLDDAAKKAIVRDHLVEGYTEKKVLIRERFPELSEEELQLAYIMLRVNGSLPIYSPSSPAHTIDQIVLKQSGSCNGYALRLMFVLRTFGYEGDIVGMATKYIPGHVVVQLKLDNEALLIDANTNTMIVYPNTNDDFFETIRNRTPEEIEHQMKIYSFPYFERGFMPPVDVSVHYPAHELNSTYRNNVYTADIKKNWLAHFTLAHDELINSLVFHTDEDLALDRGINDYGTFWNLPKQMVR